MLEAVKQQQQQGQVVSGIQNQKVFNSPIYRIIIVPPAKQLPPLSSFQASAPQLVNVPSSSRIEEVSQYEHAVKIIVFLSYG
jgi:hypothetical protein